MCTETCIPSNSGCQNTTRPEDNPAAQLAYQEPTLPHLLMDAGLAAVAGEFRSLSSSFPNFRMLQACLHQGKLHCICLFFEGKEAARGQAAATSAPPQAVAKALTEASPGTSRPVPPAARAAPRPGLGGGRRSKGSEGQRHAEQGRGRERARVGYRVRVRKMKGERRTGARPCRTHLAQCRHRAQEREQP